MLIFGTRWDTFETIFDTYGLKNERFFLGDPVCNVVNLTKTVLYMGEMNHYFVAIQVFVGANSPNYGKNEENMIINGNIAVKYQQI